MANLILLLLVTRYLYTILRLEGTVSTSGDGEFSEVAENGKRLSGGASAGIAIGVIAFVAIAAYGSFFLWRRYSRRGVTEEDIEMESAMSRIQTIQDVEIKERLGGGNFGSVNK